MKGSVSFLFLVTLLAEVLTAPQPSEDREPGPLAVIGTLVQRLQTNFYEGSNSVGQPSGISFPIVAPTEGTTTTTTTTTTTQRPTFKPTSAFDSINAILENISRSSSNTLNKNYFNNNNDNNNNVFGNVPGRNLVSFTTAPPFLAPTTTQSPFHLEGISQGISAFIQAFVKTNVEKFFKQVQDHQKVHNTIPTKSEPQPPPQNPSFGEILSKGLFNFNQQQHQKNPL